jgi:hypothetical protein
MSRSVDLKVLSVPNSLARTLALEQIDLMTDDLKARIETDAGAGLDEDALRSMLPRGPDDLRDVRGRWATARPSRRGNAQLRGVSTLYGVR